MFSGNKANSYVISISQLKVIYLASLLCLKYSISSTLNSYHDLISNLYQTFGVLTNF